MRLELALEAIEQRERVRAGAGEAGEHPAVGERAHLARPALHHRLAERDLAVAGHGRLAVATDGDHGRRVDPLLPGHGAHASKLENSRTAGSRPKGRSADARQFGRRQVRLPGARLDLCLARERMRPFVDLEQSIDADVRVALRRRQAGVAEELLDRAQVGAGVEQMRRAGVAERVGVQVGPRAAPSSP